jgi:hypothetical protein
VPDLLVAPECPADLPFDEAEQQQGQADHPDQCGDAFVVLHEDGVTASGPLKSLYLRSTAPWPLCRRKTSLASACSGVRVVSSAYQPSTAASAWSTFSSKCQDKAGRPIPSVVISVRRQPETTPMHAAIFSAVL